MIDMHSHILHGVDDGPDKMEESISLLKQAVSEGITGIISTSHAYHPQFNVTKEIVIKQVQTLNALAKDLNLPIQVYTGQELRLKDNTASEIITDDALTLADSKYVLLELPSQEIPAYTIQIIQDLLNQNKIPIIAHPERNKAIAEKPSRLARLITHGALAQVTAGSLAGHFGRSIQKTALQLVDAHLVHVYGSDVHNSTTRPFLFNKGLDYLDKQKRHELTDILLENNSRIITNQDFILLEPEELEKQNWWKIFS